MKFYCICNSTTQQSFILLKEACKKRKIEFVHIDPETFDYTQKEPISKNDLLYRISIGRSAKLIQIHLSYFGPTTFYKTKKDTYKRYRDSIIHFDNHGIPAPKTFYDVPKDKKILSKYIEALGGFPVILKCPGGSHGIGVMKIDSFSSLFSIVDFMHSKNHPMILREFINVKKSARLIVIGNEVVDTIEYSAPENDFRSNEGACPNVKAKTFPKKMHNIAIKATNLLDIEFGGVDILIDEKKNYFLTEVNFPCFFPRCQQTTNVDIAGKMLDFLIQKNKKENSKKQSN